MFHTFQSAAALPGSTDSGDPAKPSRSSSRRISTTNACVECRRRKIRCDGTQPCGQCLWYQHPELCSYSKPAQRVVPSRKLVEKLQGQIDQQRLILERLFPGKDLEALSSTPREELLNLALTLPAPSATSPAVSIPQTTSEPTPDSDGPESLEAALEAAPDENPEWDEARKHQIKIQGISDDVNGLSLSVDRPSSYVGVSSMTAALKVIVKTAPLAKSYINYKQTETALPSRSGTPPPEFRDTSPNALPNVETGLDLIDNYFEKVHPFFPMVEESKFRAAYIRQQRWDSAWLALLNMVFALGSLASSTADNEAHYVFFVRSRKHLSLETFGSGNLEVLQALGMMTGYYMHYLNRPNEASCLMGATLRMATGLGLHREYSNPASPNPKPNGMSKSRTDAQIAETRRRTWWSIFCLDVWASTTTSRPSLGRISSAVTVLPPGKVLEDPSSPENMQDLRVLPLIYNIEFCKIASRIQDTLATSPLLKYEDLVQIDNDLVSWRTNLPSILATNEPCPEFLRVPRSVMKWRYENLRVVLHRPFLLSTALKRTSFANLSAEEKVAVGKCRVIAAQNIEDISNECTPDLISGWNAVWFCFQACMVPLISLFADISNPDEIAKWRNQIEMALNFFDRMERYSVAAKKSREAIARLAEASKVNQEQLEEQMRQRQELWEQQRAANAQANAGNEGQNFQQFGDNRHSPSQQQQFQQQQSHQQQQRQQSPNNPFPPGSVAGQQPFPNMSGMSGIGMGVWPPPEMGPGGPSSLGSLSGFWDEMMWDTFPEISEDPFGGFNGEFDFPPASQDGGGAPCWQLGN
ncbi:fungal specific transcription factor domain-containing protein [Botryosphaeria dothidea]|uniref:Fungal specific transcription factor domain-containing protein n=1 Tax=Botryosphaeria dothidea TaxID=55169 RepID=A0A8H4II77_9PEZI|nr:fungal specific transcription factor domain-containing protein [Botryosphaeria dothidea]KAF4305797.1 fungal specific transcription factor domain-containing protein [Botryosphaeria dothidea]